LYGTIFVLCAFIIIVVDLYPEMSMPYPNFM